MAMQQKCKNNVLTIERKYIGQLYYDHADQLLDNLDDIKDIFDKYLAVKLYNWRYKWFCNYYEHEEWTTDDGTDNWSFGDRPPEDITFDSIPYNVCMNWHVVLDKYFEDDRPIHLPSNKHYSDLCRAKLDNEGLVPYYFRCCIPFPDEFIYMLNMNASNKDGERVLRDNLTPLQLEDFEKEQQDYYYVYSWL